MLVPSNIPFIIIHATTLEEYSELFARIILHEIGHVLGIAGHSYDRGDVMYSPLNDQNVPILSSRDIMTARKLYEDWTDFPLGRPAPDINQDGVVSAADIVMIAKYFGRDNSFIYEHNPDLNGDMLVDIDDLILGEVDRIVVI